jgi:hypothetical protein
MWRAQRKGTQNGFWLKLPLVAIYREEWCMNLISGSPCPSSSCSSATITFPALYEISHCRETANKRFHFLFSVYGRFLITSHFLRNILQLQPVIEKWRIAVGMFFFCCLALRNGSAACNYRSRQFLLQCGESFYKVAMLGINAMYGAWNGVIRNGRSKAGSM